MPTTVGLPEGLIRLADVLSRSAVLLGEAGAGKTHALTGLLQDTTLHDPPRWDARARVDLGQVDRWEDLARKAAPVLSRLPAPDRSAPPPGARFLLVIDGVDECRAKPKHIAGWIEDLARTYDCRALQVIFACRSTAFTDVLRRAVAEAFGVTTAHVIAPLRRQDIHTAAAARSVDPDAFARAVTDAGAEALARMPLTLNLLLDLYQADRSLPLSRAELYRRALPLTVMRQGDGRDPDDLHGDLEQRLAVAGRIACHLLLTGAPAVSLTRRPLGDDRHLAVDDLIGPEAPVTPARTGASQPVVRSVLEGPLFTGAGPGLVKPVHASIASYLAARHLLYHNLPQAQLRSLLVQRGDGGTPGILGDLHELAAWLVALRPALGSWLIDADPEALAAYSSYIDDPECQRAVVDRLLERARAGRLNVDPWRHGPASRFHHPGLAAQLRPVLTAAAAALGTGLEPGVEELEFALATVADSNLTELLTEVSAIAADPRRRVGLRSRAAAVAVLLDRPAAAKLLKPVLIELRAHPERDPAHLLRGQVLNAVWPEQLTATELLAFLVPPHRGSSVSYEMFCVSLPSRLAETDLAPFLHWATQALTGHPPASAACDTNTAPNADRQWSAWAHADDMTQDLLDRAMAGPGAADRIPATARWLNPLLRTYPMLAVPLPLCTPDTTPGAPEARHLRRLLAMELLGLAQDEEDAYLVAEGWTPRPALSTLTRRIAAARRTAAEPVADPRYGLLDSTDLPWLLEAERDLDDRAASFLRPLIADCWFSNDPTAQETAWATRGTRIWTTLFAPYFDPVPLHGPHADRMRERARRAAARRRAPRQWDGYDAWVEDATDLLHAAEAGDPDSFWQLCVTLRRDPDTGREDTNLHHHLTTLPAAAVLPDGAEHRLLAAARRYLDTPNTSGTQWIGTDTIPWRAWAGVLALTELHTHPTSHPHTIAPAHWRRWAPALLALPTTTDATDARTADLLRHATLHAADELHDTFFALLDAAITREEFCDALLLASHIRTAGFATRLTATVPDYLDRALHDDATQPATPGNNVMHHTLTTLLRLACDVAGPEAGETVLAGLDAKLRAMGPGRRSPLAVELLAFLLETSPVRAWPTVVDWLRAGPESFDLIERRILDRGRTQWLDSLTEQQAADLAELLIDRYPYAMTHPPRQSRWVGHEEDGPEHRDTVVQHLAARGSADSVGELRCLAHSRPHAKPLARALRTAQRNHRERTWSRPAPHELDALLQDPRRRLVRDGADLTDLVLDALATLQYDLTHGTFPAALMWNDTTAEAANGEPTRRRMRYPKEENLISDYLAHHLTTRLVDSGIVIGREVQINRNIGGAGDRLDLLLQTVATGNSALGAPAIPTLAIEVKGNWHPKLHSAMETQLADDYIPTLNATHGLYLVAYFPAAQWTSPARKMPPALRNQTPDTLHSTLQEQAATLSTERGTDIRAALLDFTLRETADRNRKTTTLPGQ
ncbi:NACHT domain-containing protein [Kitasatospora griseola]|uniref:NACHT domain-containing protein n=1 Tax=Kitasatospora griseola TaxID=2064 RepID=UPI001379315E|nr:NACHT domain-containing protein [Kitasatospora griseola]